MANIQYAKGPLVYLYDLETRSKKQKELLWGDWLRIGDDIDADWSEVKWGKDTLAIRKDDYQAERLLEMIFLDVGQGDGCILTSPHTGAREKIMIIDAGERSNMNRYLRWRFRDFKRKFKFHAAVITHPDKDHYLGFQPVFETESVSFANVFHNGLLERTGDDLLGPVEDGFLTDIKTTKTAARNLYKDEAVRGGKLYPKLVWTALSEPDRFDNVSMLSNVHGAVEDGQSYVPGFAPSNDENLTIEVLGPVVQKSPSGVRGLRTFARTITAKAMDDGKTKNGHSVLLRLKYRDFTILFGGDLNAPAEHFLVRHYGNDDEAPTTLAETEAMLEKAGDRFKADLMKSCHHGASDVTDEFLEVTNAAGFIVSSGDSEGHVHPRPDLLGLLGKKGRGTRPLVLCTELQRSTREREDPDLRNKLARLDKKIKEEEDADEKKALEKQKRELLDVVFKRNVGVYGAINVRTDGRTAVVAFRFESGKGVKKWFIYEIEKGADGEFAVKHAGH